MTLEMATRHIAEQWGEKTLATLCTEARREINGTHFDSLREEGCSRFALFLCVTGPFELAKLQPHLEPALDLLLPDWSQVSYAEAYRRAHQVGGLGYAIERETNELAGGPVVLICARPGASAWLEALLGLGA